MDSGAVVLFDTATGTQLSVIAPAGLNESDRFGRDIDLVGSTLVVGASGDDAGAVYVFDVSDPVNPVQLHKLVPSDPARTSSMGRSLATDGARLLIGAERDGASRDLGGAGYQYQLADDPAPCPADVNGDGELTPADFNAWIIAFNTHAPACDQNGDGLCAPADFNAWIVNYNAGC